MVRQSVVGTSLNSRSIIIVLAVVVRILFGNVAFDFDDLRVMLVGVLLQDFLHFDVVFPFIAVVKDVISTIFDRFVKVDEFKEGLGLGLAYCHETVEKLGGTLTLDKTSEEGTTFTLSLPIKLKTTE